MNKPVATRSAHDDSGTGRKVDPLTGSRPVAPRNLKAAMDALKAETEPVMVSENGATNSIGAVPPGCAVNSPPVSALSAAAELDRLYAKRSDELTRGNHYDAGQTWAEFQKVACSTWPLISAALKSEE